MEVLLKRDWFFNGMLYEKRDHAIKIPDELFPELPKDAEVIDRAKYVAKPDPDVLTTLADFDSVRHEGDLTTAFVKKPRKK